MKDKRDIGGVSVCARESVLERKKGWKRVCERESINITKRDLRNYNISQNLKQMYIVGISNFVLNAFIYQTALDMLPCLPGSWGRPPR